MTLNRIDKESAEVLIEKIKNAVENIVLNIDSVGGSVIWAFKIFEEIRKSKYPITGVVNGKAGSSAVYVLQACEKRIAFSHSKIHLHTVAINEDHHLVDKEMLEEAETKEREMAEFIAERSGMKTAEVIGMMREKRKLSADEALGLKLVDKVVLGEFFNSEAA